MAKVKMAACGALALLVITAMVLDPAQAACTIQFPIDCVSYVVDGLPQPYKFCCIEIQDQFLLKPNGLQLYCDTLKAVHRYNGDLAMDKTAFDLALSIPSKCNLNEYYKKNQKCLGRPIPGGSK